MSWRKFAFKAKENNQETLHFAMVGRDPILKTNFEIEYTIANEIQLGFIKTHKIDLINFLKRELNNKEIKLTLKIDTIESIKPATSRDKFKEMTKRNPDLDNLRKRFKLDFDY